MLIEQIRKEYFTEAERRGLFPKDLNNCPVAHDNISDERALSLFWWWCIEKDFGYSNLEWRDSLTPEEQAFVAKLDASKQT